jgi:hypothetical protein
MNSDNTLDIVQALGGNTPGSSDLSKGEAAQRLDLASAEALLDFVTGDPFAELDPEGLDETTRSLVREVSTELHRAGAAAASTREAPIEVGDKLVALRRLPLHTTRLEGAMPPWSAGMAAEHHIGPLSDRTGRLFWIDVFRRVRQYRFVRSAGAPPFLTLPIVQFGLAPQAGTFRAGATFDVAAGSLWLATNLFAAAPTNTYSGVRISGGSIRFTADVIFGNEEAVVPLSVGVDLTLQFAPPVVEMPARGSEFSETQFEPPEGIAVSIRPGAATIAVRGTAKLAVWGSEVELVPQAATPHYQAELNRLVVPMKPDGDSLVISHVASVLFVPSGQARIRAAGLALPAAVVAPGNLGEASGVGALMLEMNAGLAATWQGERRSVRLGETLLLLDGTRLSFTSRETRAENDVVRLRLPFSEAAGLTYTRLDKTSVLYLTVSNGAEWVTLSAAVDVRLPKPVDVTGGCLGSRLPQTRLVISSTVGGERTLLLSGLTAVLPQERPAAFALTNAVLRVTRPRAFLLVALLQDDAIAEGLALTAYGLRGLLPSLPDPYAANTVLGPRFDARSQGYLLSQFAFSDTGQELRFALPPNVAVVPPLAGPGFAAPSPTMDARGLIAAGELARAHGDIFEFEGQSKIILVDVSTNASRFGVAVRPPRRDDRQDAPRQQQALHAPQVQGLDLAVDGRMLVLLTLPSVQWEPVRAVPGPEPFPDEVRFANSGVPTTVDVPSVELIPVNPLAAYDAIVENFAQKSPQASRARFTLPFGMLANARLSAPSPSGRGALVSEVRPSSTNLKGAHQLRIAAADPRLPSEETPALPGFTVQLSVASPTDGSGPTSILGSSVNMIFNLYLGAGQPTALVPVTHIDLSGHGESLFSTWANPDDSETGVSKAEFQVVNGRAAKEVVQVKSVLLPYFVPVVRTITLERKGNAIFTREDSGWVAVRDGLYRASPGSGIVTHPGVVQRATQVTNIHETGSAISAGGAMFVAAYFDTDLVIDGAATPVPARRQLGYVKLSTPDLTPAAYASLIQSAGPMGGPIDVGIAIGGGRQRMRLHRVGVGVAGPEFAMAGWGSLVFPGGGGDWSVLEAQDPTQAPTQVAADLGMPIIRQGAAGTPSSAPWRFADPEDLFDVTTPLRDYGILHSMGTQRAFFRRLRVEATSPDRIVSTERPVIADPLILATATGPFPRQADAIPFPSAAYALEVRADGSWRLDAPDTFSVGLPRRTIRSAGTVLSDLDYSGATVTYSLDTAQPVPWRFALTHALKIMAHTSMGDLMSLSADVDAQAGRASRFADPKVKVGGPFDIVQDLLTIMQDLGISAKPDVRMTNEWSLAVALKVPFVDATGEDFEVIPGEPIPTIIFSDTGVKVEIKVAPVADEAVFELGGAPMFAIKAVPGLYAVAIIKFTLRLSTESGTSYGFLIGVGIAYKLDAGPFELKGLFAITFFAVFGDTVLGYGVGFVVKLSADISPIVSIELSLEGKFARLIAMKGMPQETVFQIAKLVFAIEVSVFLVFSISLEVETKKVEVTRGPLLESDAPDVLP